MNKLFTLAMAGLVAFGSMGVIGCERERDVGDKVEDAAEDVGDKIEDAADKVND